MQEPSKDEYPRGFEPTDGKTRYSVLEEAKKSVERQAAEWTTEHGDVFPEVLYRAADGGLGVMGLAVDMNSDTDKDYVISDSEIRKAYATYSVPGESLVDFSQLEELWVAGRYTWNRKTRSFAAGAQ